MLGSQGAVGNDAPATEPAHELDTVVVTATRTERSVLDIPGTASVIDEATVERRLYRNIKDLVRYEPGVDVQNDPLRFGLAGFTIRGIGGNRVQMSVDGVRIPDAFSIGTFQSGRRNMVDVDALKTVEIIRGPASAMYGSDGIGGVVSFVTKDPRDYLDLFGKNHYESLKLLYSSVNKGFLQTATFAGTWNDLEGLLLMTHGEGDEMSNEGTDKSRSSSRTAANPQDTRNLNLLAKGLYHFNVDNRLRLTGEAFEDQVHTEVFHLYGPQYTGRDTYQLLTHDRQSRWRVSLDQSIKNIDWRWLDTLSWQLYGQVTRARQQTDDRSTVQIDTGLGTNQYRDRRFSYDQDMIGGQADASKAFEWGPSTHRIAYGAEAFRTHVEELRDGLYTNLDTGATSNFITPDNFPLRDFPNTDTLRAGAYLQDEIGLWNKQLELLPAIRFDYFGLRTDVDYLYAKENVGNPIVEQDVTEWSPKFGVLYHFTERFALHGQYTEGFRAPNFSDANSGFVNAAFGYASVPNANLKPETAIGGEVGLRGSGPAGNFDATFFRNDYDGFIQNTTVCDPANSATTCSAGNVENIIVYQTINNPDPVRIQGFEFKSQLYLGPWLSNALDGFSLLGSYAYAEGQNLKNGQPISSVTPMKGVMGVRYDAPSGNWGLEAILTLAAPKKEKDIDFELSGSVFPTPGYGVVDLTGYYRFGEHVNLNLGLFNLLDKKYTEWQDLRTRGGDPHASLDGNSATDIRDRYTRPGLNVGASLRVEF